MPPTPRVRPPLRRADKDSGFTTVEALVAFSLLAIVAGSAVLATGSVTQASKTGVDRATAANLAQQDLQSARALRFPNYPAATPARVVSVSGTDYTVSRSVSAKRPDGTDIGACPATPNFTAQPYMIVTTTVTWNGSGAKRQQARTDDQKLERLVVATELAC